MHSHLAHTALQCLGIFQDLFVDLRAVFQLVLELRYQAVAIGQGNLDVNVFHSPLEHFSVMFHDLETGLQLVQFGVVGILLLLFLRQAVRDHFGEAVALVKGHVADARHVLDGALCRHRAKGNDAGNVVRPVLALNVVVCLGQVLKVHVDIRHGNAVRIKETLKQELVLDGVQVGDSEAVSYHGACGASTAGANHRPHSPGRGNIILDDEEVVREAHSADGLELKVDALLLFLGKRFAVAFVRALESEVAEVGHGVAEAVPAVGSVLVAPASIDNILILLQVFVDIGHKSGVDVKDGQDGIPVDGVGFHLGGHLKGVFNGFRVIVEQF